MFSTELIQDFRETALKLYKIQQAPGTTNLKKAQQMDSFVV